MIRRTLLIGVVFAVGVAACSDEPAELGVADAWARPATGPNGAVYLTLEGGPTDVALTSVAVSADVAATAQIHQTVLRDDGSLGMTEMSAVEIPAGRTVMLVPGGVHLMLLDLTKPLEPETSIGVTLLFSDGTELNTQAEVRDE